MIGSITFALMLAQDMPPAAEPEPAVEQTQPAEEVEICRRKMVLDSRTAGGKKYKKICKTAEEWKASVARRD